MIELNIYYILFFAIITKSIMNIFFPNIGFTWEIWRNISAKISYKLDRVSRSNRARFIRGILFLIFSLFMAFIIGSFINFVEFIHINIKYLFGFIAFYGSINIVGVLILHLRILKLLKDLKNNRDEILDILHYFSTPISRVSRDRDVFIRASIVSIIHSFNRFFIAPIFYFAIWDFVGMFVYVFVMASTNYFENKNRFDFAYPFRVVASILDYLPNIITVIIFTICSIFVFNTSTYKAMLALFTNSKNTYKYGYWILQAVTAGIINCTLGGVALKYYAEKSETNPWFSTPNNDIRCDKNHLEKILTLISISALFIMIIILLFCIKNNVFLDFL